MKEPLISVIIPIYNPGKYLKPCLDSIINQTYRKLEIILIDDGSTDGSGEVCDRYAAQDGRVICVHQKNAGVSKARNAGLQLATGEYISFPDSDDYLELDTYEYLVRIMEEHPCDAVNFEYFVDYADHEIIHLTEDANYGMQDTVNAHRILITGEPFAWNKILSKHLIPGGGFREDIFRGEDTLFVQQALDKAETVWFDRRPLYHYVQSEQSAVRGTFRKNQVSIIKLFDAYEDLFWKKYPELLPLFLSYMLNNMISIYYDMWADEDNFRKERIHFINVYKKYFKQIIGSRSVNAKERLKFLLFYMCPTFFCRLHKVIHHL